jgi:hypothetical protein
MVLDVPILLNSPSWAFVNSLSLTLFELTSIPGLSTGHLRFGCLTYNILCYNHFDIQFSRYYSQKIF